MRLITKKNFVSLVCISFTLIVCGKLLLEKMIGFTDQFYTENIFTCLGFSVLIVVILSAHFYLQQYPFLPVVIGQYLVTIGVVFGIIFFAGKFTSAAPRAYFDMFISITVPFAVGALVYYSVFFHQIKKANAILAKLNEQE